MATALAASAASAAQTSPEVSISRELVFSGMCDASGAVSVGGHRFAVASDEDNLLRIYDADAGGPALSEVELSSGLLGQILEGRQMRPTGNGGPPKHSPEFDLEAAAQIGDQAFWLTSHGRTRKGRVVPARFVLFVTSLPQVGRPIEIVGAPYSMLLDDLLTATSLAPFDLATASARGPKELGGLNIEGLTETPDGSRLYVGFRNPTPGGRALLVPIENPRELARGRRARLGPPVLLDLGGLGVRGLTWWRGRYLIAAGGSEEGRPATRLFVWDGQGQPRELAGTARHGSLGALNVEAFFTPEDRDEFMLLSDDGSTSVGGTRCKDLRDGSAKHFRGLWLSAPGW